MLPCGLATVLPRVGITRTRFLKQHRSIIMLQIAARQLRVATRGLIILTASVFASHSLIADHNDNEPDGYQTQVKSYVRPVPGSPITGAPLPGAIYSLVPVLSVADIVPETSNQHPGFRMIGIPDGLGAGFVARKQHRDDDDDDGQTFTLYMNHELTKDTPSEPNVFGPQNRGAFVSKYILSTDGSVISGERAYDRVFNENVFVGPAPEVGNTTSSFSRFCSGALAGLEEGFDRPIYFTGEESGGAGTFDGRGGLAVAIFDNEVHTLPKLGHLPWENAVPRPSQGNEVVIMCMEDGPSTPDSQLYMYVGKKDRRSGASVLSRNGLDNGRLYAFRSKDLSRNSEVTFQTGTIPGEWVEISEAAAQSEGALEAESDAKNAFAFIRTEDGAWSKTSRKDYYFVTTGSSFSAAPGVTPANKLGRLYHLELNPGNPLKDASLTIVMNADLEIAAGRDTAVSPDNIDTSADYLMICEDGTAESRVVMASKGRDGSVWRFDLNNDFARKRVAELNPPGRDGVPVGPGIWETSGIIDASQFFGRDAWILDVQAHPPTSAPTTSTTGYQPAPPSTLTRENGQLLIMLPTRENDENEDGDEDDD